MSDAVTAEHTEGLLAEVHATLDRAAERAAVTLDPAEQRAYLCELQGLRARVESLCCSAAIDAERAALPQVEGLFSVGSLLARHTNTDAAVAGADRRLGRWLADFDRFAAAFARGALTRRHVEALRRATNHRTWWRLLDEQDWFVEQATRLGYREFVTVLRYWALGADPDGDEPAAQHARRCLSVSKTSDGTVAGRFRLDPIAGQALLSALDQESRRLLDDDREADAPRSTGQRHADALVALVSRGATRPDGRVPAPLVHLVMSEAVAEQLAAPEDGADHPALDGSVDARCELLDGTPIHLRTAARVLTTATLRRLVVAADSEILDLGRPVRLFPPHLKQALLAAARGRCRVRGCDAPVGWLQADHVLPYVRGHPTATANGQIRCGPHNRAKSDRLPLGQS